jgi:hypothetical protein
MVCKSRFGNEQPPVDTAVQPVYAGAGLNKLNKENSSMGVYNSLNTLRGKALIVTIACLGKMQTAKRPLRGKDFLEPVQELLEGFNLPTTRMVYISNVLSRLADAGHIVKTPVRFYFMSPEQEEVFSAWQGSDPFQTQLTETINGLRSFYSGTPEAEPTLEELRKQHAQGTLDLRAQGLVEGSTQPRIPVEPPPAIPALFTLNGAGKCGPTELRYVQGYRDLSYTRAYIPADAGWEVTFTKNGNDYQFDLDTGRLIRLSDGRSKKVYDPESE